MSDFKVVFQLCTDSQERHIALLKHIEHVLEEIPTILIEVVAHNKGITLLQKGAACSHDIIALKKRGVKFLACHNTLVDKGLEPSNLLKEAIVIPSGITYLIVRQQNGWCYIRA